MSSSAESKMTGRVISTKRSEDGSEISEAVCCECGFMSPCSRAVDGVLAHTFYNLGFVVGKNPWKTVMTSLFLALLLSAGFSQQYTENDQSKLWVPQGTPAQLNSADYGQYFQSRVNIVSIAAKEEEGNVLEKEKLLAAYDLMTKILEVEVKADFKGTEQSFTYTDIALTPAVFPLGLNLPPLLFPVSIPGPPSDPAVGRGILASLPQEAIYQTITASNEVQGVGLGQVTTGSDGIIESAEGYSMVFILSPEEDLADACNAWEAELIRLCLQGGEFALEGDEDVVPEWASDILPYPLAARTFGDEFGKVVTGDVGLLGFSYAIITAYVVINFGTCSVVENKVALSLLVIVTNLLAVGSGFGLSALLGIFFGPLHSVLPFVILGIGVDNAFVLVNSFERTEHHLDLHIRTARSLRHSGSSLTVTSATDFVAFLVGSFTSLPALSSFCLYAAITIFMVYILSITLLQALIVLDTRRRASGRYDVFCCCHARGMAGKEEEVEAEFTPSKTSKFLGNYYGPFLVSNMGLFTFLSLSGALLAFGVYGTLQLQVKSTVSSFIPDDSYAKATINFSVDTFQGGTQDVEIVVKDIDYSSEFAHTLLTAIPKKFSKESYATAVPFIEQPIPPTWYDKFLAFAVENNATILEAGNVDPAQFDTLIYEFAVSRSQGDVQVEVDEEGVVKVVRSRMEFVHLPIGEVVDGVFKDDTGAQVETMDKVYELTDELIETFFPTEVGSEVRSIYAFARIYVNEWETFKIIQIELVQNLSLALACVFVITTVMIGHIVTSFFVFLCVLLTVVELLGVSWGWGLSIDTTAVVNLVISVGLAVDYAAHLGHNFMGKEGTRRERVVSALEDIGAPVLNGAISTTLAVSMLSASKSYVFRVLFQQFFGACALGMFNGLVTLPCCLALFGPPSFHDVIEYDDEDEIKASSKKIVLAGEVV